MRSGIGGFRTLAGRLVMLSKKLSADQDAQPSRQAKIEVSEIEIQNLSSRTGTESSLGEKK